MIITRAAIMFANGEVVEGHDYGAVMTISNKLSLHGDSIRGFVSSSGDFFLPKEAAEIAFKAGQIKELLHELTPDDLWPQSVSI